LVSIYFESSQVMYQYCLFLHDQENCPCFFHLAPFFLDGLEIFFSRCPVGFAYIFFNHIDPFFKCFCIFRKNRGCVRDTPIITAHKNASPVNTFAEYILVISPFFKLIIEFAFRVKACQKHVLRIVYPDLKACHSASYIKVGKFEVFVAYLAVNNNVQGQTFIFCRYIESSGLTGLFVIWV